MCYKGRWERGKDGQEMFPFDANSLYVSVMCDATLTFPDINKTKVLTNPFFEYVQKYDHYIIECDIFIPTDLKFIPIATKKEGVNGCFYKYGHFYNQVYNDCDIREALKVGIRVKKVHRALVFERKIDNILAPFSNMIYQERAKV